MTSPSILNSSKTQKHDEMHLWLCDKENIKKLTYEISPPRKIDTDWKCIRWDTNGMNKTCEENRESGFQYYFVDIQKEVPIYSKNYTSKYLQGICDAIIRYQTCFMVDVKINEVAENRNENGVLDTKHKWKRVKVLEEYKAEVDWDGGQHTTINGKWYMGIRQIIVEFKPVLNSISGIMGQMKVYRDCLGYGDLLIVTYDKNERYDPILKTEGIHIMRIPEPEDTGPLFTT